MTSERQHSRRPAPPRLVAVAGGIGSGKSIVCKALGLVGYPVYDSDSRARAIVDSDSRMRRAIAAGVAPACLNPDGTLDRRALAAAVFADKEKLRQLDAIVHPAVVADLLRWAASHADSRIAFVETAIPVESGIHRVVDEIWDVTAPPALRLARIHKRDPHLSEADARARMQSQTALCECECAAPVRQIVNDDTTALLPQIASLLHQAASHSHSQNCTHGN